MASTYGIQEKGEEIRTKNDKNGEKQKRFGEITLCIYFVLQRHSLGLHTLNDKKKKKLTLKMRL